MPPSTGTLASFRIDQKPTTETTKDERPHDDGRETGFVAGRTPSRPAASATHWPAPPPQPGEQAVLIDGCTHGVTPPAGAATMPVSSAGVVRARNNCSSDPSIRASARKASMVPRPISLPE